MGEVLAVRDAYRAQEWAMLIQECSASGLTKWEFAAAAGVEGTIQSKNGLRWAETSCYLLPFNVVRFHSVGVPSTSGLRATFSKQEKAGVGYNWPFFTRATNSSGCSIFQS